jgi:hypothetical protein
MLGYKLQQMILGLHLFFFAMLQELVDELPLLNVLQSHKERGFAHL